MQSNRNNSLEPISIRNWRWAYFLDETIKRFSIFESSPYPIKNDFLFRESFLGSSSNPKKVILETWGLKMEKIRQARCACLQAGEITSVMNLVFHLSIIMICLFLEPILSHFQMDILLH